MEPLLPKQPFHVNKSACGICESTKLETLSGLKVCPHCDVPCTVGFGTSCGICKAGMKGLPERDEV